MTTISILKVTSESGTYFKQAPQNASQLQESDKYAAAQGEVYAIVDSQQSKDIDHWLVKFGAKLHPNEGDPKLNWFVFKEHVEINQTGLSAD